MVDYKAVQNIHRKLMYHDRCDIFTYDKITKANGAKSTQKTLVPLYKDVPCKISFSLRIWDTFSRKYIDVTPYEKEPKIFLDVEYDVKPGYYIEARRYDCKTKEIIATYEGQAGLPQVSLTHQEVLLDTRGDS